MAAAACAAGLALGATAAPAHAATRAAASTGCTTKTMTGNLVTAGTGWPVLGTFYQKTHFCWNGTIVTSSSATYTGTVTASGSLIGIEYKGVVAGSEGWHCYQAAGSTRPCSGNTHYAEGEFAGCIGNHCTYSYINLQSSENYKGQWFWGYRG